MPENLTPRERARNTVDEDFRELTYAELVESIAAAIEDAVDDSGGAFLHRLDESRKLVLLLTDASVQKRGRLWLVWSAGTGIGQTLIGAARAALKANEESWHGRSVIEYDSPESEALSQSEKDEREALRTLLDEQAKRADAAELAARTAKRESRKWLRLLIMRAGGEVAALLSEMDAAREQRDAEKKRADEAVAQLARYGSHDHKCCHGQCVDVGPDGPEYNMGCDCGLLDAINEGYPGIASDFEQEKALRRAEWHRANDAEAQRDAALAQAAEMRRALEPFAGAAECALADGYTNADDNPLDHYDGDDHSGLWDGDNRLSLSDLFAARAALSAPRRGWSRCGGRRRSRHSKRCDAGTDTQTATRTEICTRASGVRDARY